ncbi:MAG: HAMP domain-containing protein [bacterium]
MASLFNLQKIRNKLILALLLVTLIPITVIGGYAIYSSTHNLQESSLEHKKNKLALVEERIENYFSGIESDLFYLRDSSALDLYLSALDAGKAHSENLLLTNLRNNFLKFSRQKKIYSQVRFLDKEGFEIVRVDRKKSRSKAVASSDLQDKKDRVYFEEAIKLEKGQRYVSSLSLNRENGEIEKPINPTQRFATPVFDKKNNLQGVIVLNLKVDRIMRKLANAEEDQQTLLFIGDDGSYYYHNDPSKVWGGQNDLNTQQNFYKDYPQLASYLTTENNSIDTDTDVISYVNIKVDDNSLGKVIEITPKAVIFKAVNQFLYVFVAIIVVALLLALIVALLLSNSISKPVEALTDEVNKLSKGDLAHPIDVVSNDEIGELSKAIERLRKSMNILMKRTQG